MSDSNSFSSLFALVDSHLSKTSVQGNSTENADNCFSRIPLPSLNIGHGSTKETSSEASLTSGPQMNFPTLGLSGSPIQEVLAKQVSNMLKAKEKQKQRDEELQIQRQQLENKMKELKMKEDTECVIDLVKVVKQSQNMKSLGSSQINVALSCGSSMESLFESTFIDCDEEPESVKTPEPILPCTTDMSYILTQDIRQGKCSTFGKVLISRLKPVAAPYLLEKVDSKIVRFDFKKKSPCDLINEKLRKPQTCQNQNTLDSIGLLLTI